jgi:hypothetical protein
MGEGGPNAPCVSEVVKRLEEKDLQGGGSETASAIIERVTTGAILDRRKVAKTFLCQSKLAKSGKLGRGRQQKQTGADEGGGQGPGETPAKNHPAADAVVAEDVEEHVRKADGRPSASVRNASVDEVVREPRVAPTSSRQPLLQSRKRPSGAPRGNGQIQFPRNDNIPNLSLPHEQRRAEVDNRRAAPNGTRPTRWDQPPVQAPRRSPPRRDTRRSPERTLDNSWRRQRTPSPVDCCDRPVDAKLLVFVATALELIRSGSYISDKGIWIPQSWSNCL